jgi:uncharacterized protein (TIGR03435 family)
VAAKGAIPPETTAVDRKQIMQRMLQTLLAERFKLVVSRDAREQSVYAIVVAKNGPKLQKSALDEKDCANRTITFGNPESCHSFAGGIGRGLYGQAVDMADLAEFGE